VRTVQLMLALGLVVLAVGAQGGRAAPRAVAAGCPHGRTSATTLTIDGSERSFS
jgi:hypothetical protein